LATDDKVGRSQQKHFARDFAVTELRGAGVDPKISGAIIRAIHEKRTGCGGISRFCCEGSQSDATESYDDLTGGWSRPRKADFMRCSGIFQLRRGSSTSEDSLEIAVSGSHAFTPEYTHWIDVDLVRDC
jgi:hypothetical protein